MSVLSLIVLLVVASICGSIGQAIAGYSRTGCLGSIAVGFIGALLGQYLAGLMHLPELITLQIGGERFPVIWSIIGSTLFVAVISFLSRRRR